jgi:hypothetical protein
MKASGIIELNLDSGEDLQETISYFKLQAETWSETTVEIEVLGRTSTSVTLFYKKVG